MTGSAGFLDFFVLEGSEYVEQLDGLLLGGGTGGPDPVAMQRVARALRGSSTMARLEAFSELAGAVERVGRALADETIAWEPALGAALVSAVDDLKLLIRNARAWSAADDDRARTRAAELARLAPTSTQAATAPRSSVSVDTVFFAAEATNIAAGVELLATRPGDRETVAPVLQRVRALRGVAGIRDVPGFADALDAIEDATRGLERGDGRITAEADGLLRTVAALLRRIAVALREGTSLGDDADERRWFETAVERWFESETERERIVPITELFFEDAGPHVVDPAENPPSTPEERYRLERVSRGEHLAALVESIRGRPGESQSRARRETRGALRAIQAVADSFGDQDTADRAVGIATALQGGAPLDLEALQSLADHLRGAPPVARPSGWHRPVPETAFEPTRTPTPRDRTPVAATPVTGSEAPTHAPEPEPMADAEEPMIAEGDISFVGEDEPALLDYGSAHDRWRTSGVGSRTPVAELTAIDAGIAAIERLEVEPLAQPVVIRETEIVPVETLLYRGRGALTRAIELRDELRRQSAARDEPKLDELFDLLDLALTE